MATESRRSGQPKLFHVVVTFPDSARPPARGLGAWLQKAAPARAQGEVTVALVSDGRMRTLNRAFRGKDYATDVLSFPVVPRSTFRHAQGRPEPPRGATRSRPLRAGTPRSPVHSTIGDSLGDIVIASGVARRQAAEAGHSLGTELRVLALHGLLHLLGYDHERDQGEMTRVEARLRRAAGLKEGLIERRRGRETRPARSRTRR